MAPPSLGDQRRWRTGARTATEADRGLRASRSATRRRASRVLKQMSWRPTLLAQRTATNVKAEGPDGAHSHGQQTHDDGPAKGGDAVWRDGTRVTSVRVVAKETCVRTGTVAGEQFGGKRV